MKKLLISVAVVTVVVIAVGATYVTTRPSPFGTKNPLIASDGPIQLLDGFTNDPLAEGWGHRKFLTVKAASYELVDDEELSALRCETENSASILARDTSIPVNSHPILSWAWKVTKPIDSELDETTEAGDDHPVRFFLGFSNENGDKKHMEIIWSNKQFAPGEYKIIGDFYHYVANGLDENVGPWHQQNVDLRTLYDDIGGTGTPTLDTLGFFCDSDNAGGSSEGFFKDIVLSPGS